MYVVTIVWPVLHHGNIPYKNPSCGKFALLCTWGVRRSVKRNQFFSRRINSRQQSIFSPFFSHSIFLLILKNYVFNKIYTEVQKMSLSDQPDPPSRRKISTRAPPPPGRPPSLLHAARRAPWRCPCGGHQGGIHTQATRLTPSNYAPNSVSRSVSSAPPNPEFLRAPPP